MMILIAIVVLLLPLSMIWWARAVRASGDRAGSSVRRIVASHILIFLALYVGLILVAIQTVQARPSQEPAVSEQSRQGTGGLSLGDGVAMLGIAIATGLSVLGAGYAVGLVGSAALGVIAEKPELFGRTLIFIGLAEGLAIYGLIISILLLGRLQ